MKRSKLPIIIIILCLIAAIAALVVIYRRSTPVQMVPDPIPGAVKWYLDADGALLYEADTIEQAAVFGRLIDNALPSVPPDDRFIKTTLLIGYGFDEDRAFDIYISPELDHAVFAEPGVQQAVWLRPADEDYTGVCSRSAMAYIPYAPQGYSLTLTLEGTTRALGMAGYEVELIYPGGQGRYENEPVAAAAAFTCVDTVITLECPKGEGAFIICFTGAGGNKYEFAARAGEQADYALESGVYDVLVTYEPAPGQSLSGRIYYRFDLEVIRPPRLLLSSAELLQGQPAAVRLINVPKGEYFLPALNNEGKIPMAMLPDGAYAAIISVPVLLEPGDYTVRAVSAGGETVAESPLRTLGAEFERQDLTVSAELGAVSNDDNQRLDNQKLAGIYDNPIPQPQWQGSFAVPCEGGVTTRFAQQRYVNGVFSSTHSGVDIAAGEGTDVKAAAAGRVIFADELIVSGNTVIIDHGMGVYTSYLHMSGLDVSAGDIVRQGDVIGLVGSTGFSTGPHLHWTVRINERIVDPFWMTENDLTELIH